MPGKVIIGLQWGDEGKGKISAYLCRNARLVVRFNGGANAGHTVPLGNTELRLHLLPAGVVSCRKAAIGPGVYLDIRTLIDEIKIVQEIIGEIELTISPRAHIVLGIHRELDGYLEDIRGGKGIGTTRRGIGPAAMFKYGRIGLRIIDIIENNISNDNLRFISSLMGWKYSEYKYVEEVRELRSEIDKIRRYVGNVSNVIRSELQNGQTVIFEGAQGTMLDLDHGTYPYVTSSTTLASAAAHGVGISLKELSEVIGIIKAYTTRVGEGPLPTEISGKLAEEIRMKGKEFGATTGRPRRIGWLDLFQLNYAARLNGVDKLIITHLDTLSGLTKLKVCVGYELDGEKVQEFPETVNRLSRVSPIYAELEGWDALTREQVDKIVKEGYGALPRPMRKYIEFVEDSLKIPVKLISIGPRIQDVIER
ncbi:MAG: adenylosuccinate synthase [Nitrososphaerota archaeon]